MVGHQFPVVDVVSAMTQQHKTVQKPPSKSSSLYAGPDGSQTPGDGAKQLTMSQLKERPPSDLVRKYAAQSVPEKFRFVLKQRLADCLRTFGRDWVTPDEFENFFNCESAKEGYNSLDTKHMTRDEFFAGIEEVFAVETDQNGTVKKVFEASMGTSRVHQKRFTSSGLPKAAPSGSTSGDMMLQYKERPHPDLVWKYAVQSVPEKFRVVLKQKLADCLRKCGRDWVTPEEFEDFFNRENADKGHRPLDTKHMPRDEYFRRLDDVFAVETDQDGTVKKVFEADVGSSRVHRSLTSTAGLLPLSPAIRQRNNGELSTRGLPMNDLIVCLRKMNLRFQGRTISINEYLEELELCFPEASASLLRRERNKVKLAEFISEHSDEGCDVCKFGDDLTVGSQLSTQHTHLHAFPYSEALSVDDPPSCTDIVVLVNEVDVGSPYLRMYVTFFSRLTDRYNLQIYLKTFYEHSKSFVIPAKQVFPGMVCVVPFDGKSDFRRAVVLGEYYDFHVKVAYVDFGTVNYVPIEWLRYLQPRFFRDTVFAEPVSLSKMLDWPARRLARTNLLNKTILMRLRSLDRIDDSFVAKKDCIPDWAVREPSGSPA